MNDRAHAVVEDGVIVVLAILGEAVSATLLAAMEVFRAEVPAARTLHKIAADSGHVANLWRSNARGSFGQGGVLLLNNGMTFDLGERHQRADTKALIVLANPIEPSDLADIHQARGTGDAVFHQIEQIDAAGFED